MSIKYVSMHKNIPKYGTLSINKAIPIITKTNATKKLNIAGTTTNNIKHTLKSTIKTLENELLDVLSVLHFSILLEFLHLTETFLFSFISSQIYFFFTKLTILATDINK